MQAETDESCFHAKDFFRQRIFFIAGIRANEVQIASLRKMAVHGPAEEAG
jgi:hypothetical protein